MFFRKADYREEWIPNDPESSSGLRFGMTDANGISQKEAFVLLENDIPRSGRGQALRCDSELMSHIPIAYSDLNETRKSVLLSMCFNLGISGLLEFKNTLAFIGAGDFERVADSMLASRWVSRISVTFVSLFSLF